jgi:hypothetical protein
MKTSNRVQLIDDKSVEALQDAGDQVSDLTLQGYHPTEAVAKVASALQLPLHKTELLIYAYNNGVSAEKRASAGGPFERLQSFPLADPVKVKELVYGAEAFQTKSASLSLSDNSDSNGNAGLDFLPLGMATFDTDLSGMTQDEASAALGFETKTAGAGTDKEDAAVGDDDNSGLSISRTTVRIELCPTPKKEKDARFVHKIPESVQEQIEAGFKMMSPELNSDIETSLLQALGIKEGAMHRANGEADTAYAEMLGLLEGMRHNIQSRHLSPSFKSAGLTSVNAYYPDIASILSSYVGEVDAYLIKHAECSLLDTTVNHPWVAEAKRLYESMEKVAGLTVTANRCTEEYKAVCDLYKNRARYKAADWRQFLAEESEPEKKEAGVADLLGLSHIGSEGAKKVRGLFDPEAEVVLKKKEKLTRDALSGLDDPLHESTLRDIDIQNMIGDFSVNDEILSAFPLPDLLTSYNDLLRVSPNAMRNRAQARSLLQQYMTQGRMAPTELLPALEMNRLAARKPDENAA